MVLRKEQLVEFREKGCVTEAGATVWVSASSCGLLGIGVGGKHAVNTHDATGCARN
jgi:hypothetical protein